MAILPTNRASTKGVGVKEESYAPVSKVLPSKIIIAGNYDPSKSPTENEPKLIASEGEAGNLYGYGSQIHRMMRYSLLGTGGQVETYAFPLADPSGVASTADITISGTATSSGTLSFRIGSMLTTDIVNVSIPKNETIENIATSIVDAITEKTRLPFRAEIDGVLASKINLTAKTADLTGDDYTIAVNITEKEIDNSPEGIIITITQPNGGAGESELTELISFIESDDSPWFTDLVVPYKSDTALTALANMVGNANDTTGLWDDLDFRPLNYYVADTTSGDIGRDSAIALADRPSEQGLVVFGAGGSYEAPHEIAAYASAVISVRSNLNPSMSHVGAKLVELYGAVSLADNYSRYYNVRDTLYKSGVTPIYRKDKVQVLGDVVTTYAPNGNFDAQLKLLVSQRKTFNIANDIKQSDKLPENQNRGIVDDVGATDPNVKAIDTDIVTSRISALSVQWAQKAWIFNSAFTQKNIIVTIDSENPDRFNKQVPVILSGNNRIEKTEISVDRNTDAINLVLR